MSSAGGKRSRLGEDEVDEALLAELDEHEEYVPLKNRKMELAKKATAARRQPSQLEIMRRQDAEDKRRLKAEQHTLGPESQRNLLDEHARIRRQNELIRVDPVQKQLEEEAEILQSIRAAKELKSVAENALGIEYTKTAETSWEAPRFVRERSEAQNDALRKKFNIKITGEDCVAPCKSFAEMKLHPAIQRKLAAKNILTPTPIQMQGLPVILSGRDMVGVAFTGSGKTLVFGLPALMFSFEQERKMPFIRGEGPYSIIMCPTRELARQTYDNIKEIADCLVEAGEPPLCLCLCMGGININDFLQGHAGVHMVFATPGRLMDMLKRGRFTLGVCRYFALDEADRMIDANSEEDIRTILSYFKGQRQTIMFSATMPTKIKDFAISALVNPITVIVGHTGAANLDVIQEVEYVKQEAKVMYLLECLQKTPPPVLVFSAKKGEVDDMYEYLLLKGVEAVAIHGGKDQEERDLAIRAFKEGRKDVLVATDVASKGLDFPQIQHVINFDMPVELEDYVHRIGRTGRAGKTGIATTFINKMVEQTTLMDLKYLLLEAKQRVPPFLVAYTSEAEQFLTIGGTRGCSYCGGLGHRITDCPKRETSQAQATLAVGNSDYTRENDDTY